MDFRWVIRQSITHSQLKFLTPSHADTLSLYFDLSIYVCDVCVCVCVCVSLSLSLSLSLSHIRSKTQGSEDKGLEEIR
jgi:hypothetical protein